jgi:hypothetical protein
VLRTPRNDGRQDLGGRRGVCSRLQSACQWPRWGSRVREYSYMFRTAFAAAAVLVAALTMVVELAHAQPRRVEVGTLTCTMSSSIGLIVGSQKNVNCVFRGQPGEPEEAYTGTMTTVGLDIGITTGGVIVWTVFADTSRFAGMLAGKYVGATGEVSDSGGSRRQCAGRRLAPDCRAATALLARPSGSRYRRRHWRARSASRSIMHARDVAIACPGS